MANVHITEFASMSRRGGAAQVAEIPPLAYKRVAIGASPASSDPVSAEAKLVRIYAEEDCFIAFDEDASTQKLPMAGGTTEWYSPKNGATPFISVIQA